MAGTSPRMVLNYLEDKKRQFGGRAICMGQDAIAAALGSPVDYVVGILESLAEQGKVHKTSPGCWTLGKGTFGRWG